MKKRASRDIGTGWSRLWGVLLAGLVLAFLPVLVVGAAVVMPFAKLVSLARPKAAKAPVAVAEADTMSSYPSDLVTATDLQDADIFRGLSIQQLAQVAALGRTSRLSQGTVLAKVDDLGTTLYVILQGRIQLTTDSPAGGVTIRIAGPGESLPLAALLNSGRLITTVRVMSDVVAVEIPCAAFRDLCRQQPDIGVQVYKAVANILGDRYRTTLTRLVSTLQQALRQADLFANV